MTGGTTTLRCRSCGARELERVIDLGETPLANGLLRKEQLLEPESRYPLRVALCTDCGLAQLENSVDPKMLFSEYLYASSVGPAVVQNASNIARRMMSRLYPGDLVGEIASNDGYLLQHYVSAGHRTVGVDPAHNLVEAARRRGVVTIAEFFSLECGRRLRQDFGAAAVIHANNVLAHVPDVNDFVAGLAYWLAPGGLAVIEFPYLGDLVANLEFDTIYHEHVFYYSLTALKSILARQALRVEAVERIPIHGGSLRVFVGRGEEGETTRALLAGELTAGLGQAHTLQQFAARVRNLRDELVETIRGWRDGPHSLAAYGASAKGATLLNYCNLDRRQIEFVVDRSPLKVGLFTPGSHIPILHADSLAERAPEATLLLSWNFEDEIVSQQQPYLEAGGKFLVPVPHPRFSPAPR